MNEPIDFDTAIRKAREATAAVTLATGFYPRKDHAGHPPRRPSERRALCRAVFHAVEEARKSGLIVRTADGYGMRW